MIATKHNFIPFGRSAEFYDLLHEDKNYQLDSQVYAKLLPKPPGRMIEWGCGTGNYMQQFIEFGWNVTGVEPSAQMQLCALRKGLHVRSGRLPASPFFKSEKFDAAVAPFSVLGYACEDNSSLVDSLCTIRRHLYRGSSFVFDVIDYHAASTSLRSTEEKAVKNKINIRESREKEFDSQRSMVVVKSEFSLITQPPFGNERWTETHRMRAFSAMEIELALRYTGFQVTSITKPACWDEFYLLVAAEAA